MNVLILSPYPREGASFRFRILQYLPYFESQGLSCTVRCFLSSWEFARVHQPRYYLVKSTALLAWTSRLMAALARARAFDVVLVHRELYPLGMDYFEQWLQRTRCPVVLDVDDAIFLPQPHGSRFLRRFRDLSKVSRLAAMSRLVVTSNTYLSDWFRRHNASIEVIPTAIDTMRFQPRLTPRPPGPLTIGWIGSPSTSYYLERLLPVLRRLRQQHVFQFKVVGAGPAFQSNGVIVIREPWRLEDEVAAFQSLDIGVYPLPDDPWAVGKGGFKSIEYMAVGVPVVASPVGVNREMIRHGENGLLAQTEDEWVDALSRLLEDAPLRQRLGQAGRETVMARYSTSVQGPRLVACLHQVMSR